MKNMWFLVSVILAGIALWLWRKTTPGAPTRPLKQGQPPYMAIRNAVVMSGKTIPTGMIPGVVYVERMAPTLVPGIFKNVYHYIDPDTRLESAGVTPPIIRGVKWV